MSWRRGDDSTVTTLPEPEVGRDVPPLPPPAPPAPPMAPWRKAAVGVILAALVGGLVWQYAGDGGDGGDEVATPTSVTAATTAAPVTVPVDPSRAPELRNTGENWESIVRSLDQFSDWVYQHDPDPKWAAAYLDPECDCFERAERDLAYFKTNGLRYGGPSPVARKVILRDRLGPDQVTLYVVSEGVAAPIVDRQGTVVRPNGEVYPPTGKLLELVRREGRWRTFQTTVLGPPQEGWQQW